MMNPKVETFPDQESPTEQAASKSKDFKSEYNQLKNKIIK